MEFQFTTYIERGDDEVECRVTYRASPYVAATLEQPAEGPEVELVATQFACGALLPLTRAEEIKVFDECEARVRSDFHIAHCEAEDARADMRRDDLMMEKWNES